MFRQAIVSQSQISIIQNLRLIVRLTAVIQQQLPRVLLLLSLQLLILSRRNHTVLQSLPILHTVHQAIVRQNHQAIVAVLIHHLSHQAAAIHHQKAQVLHQATVRQNHPAVAVVPGQAQAQVPV
jgi:hypothetical protein